jgi:hypothetical protein
MPTQIERQPTELSLLDELFILEKRRGLRSRMMDFFSNVADVLRIYLSFNTPMDYDANLSTRDRAAIYTYMMGGRLYR